MASPVPYISALQGWESLPPRKLIQRRGWLLPGRVSVPGCPWAGSVYLLVACLVPQFAQWLVGTHAFHWDFCKPCRLKVFSSQLEVLKTAFQKHSLGPQLRKGNILYTFSSFSCHKLTPHSLLFGALSYLYWGINTKFINQFQSLFSIPAQGYMIQAKPGGREHMDSPEELSTSPADPHRRCCRSLILRLSSYENPSQIPAWPLG